MCPCIKHPYSWVCYCRESQIKDPDKQTNKRLSWPVAMNSPTPEPSLPRPAGRHFPRFLLCFSPLSHHPWFVVEHPEEKGRWKGAGLQRATALNKGGPVLSPLQQHTICGTRLLRGRGWHDPDPLVHAPSSHTFTQRNRDSHLHHRGHNPGCELRIKAPVWCSQGGVKSRWSPKWIQHWNQSTRWFS